MAGGTKREKKRNVVMVMIVALCQVRPYALYIYCGTPGTALMSWVGCAPSFSHKPSLGLSAASLFICFTFVTFGVLSAMHTAGSSRLVNTPCRRAHLGTTRCSLTRPRSRALFEPAQPKPRASRCTQDTHPPARGGEQAAVLTGIADAAVPCQL